MKTITHLPMKTALLISLNLALALSAPAATIVPIPYSQEPRATTVNTNDDVIMNTTNAGTGTWTTKRATVKAVAAAMAPIMPVGSQGYDAALLSSNTVPLPQLPGNLPNWSQVSTTALFGDTNALAFASAANISDPAARSDLVGCVNELKAAGVWSNLVDAVILKARFNPGSNLTLMGRSFYSSNITYGAWGGNFNGSMVRVDGLPDLRTNSMVIVWRYPRTASLTNSGWLAGAVDTNSVSGAFLMAVENSFLKFGFRVGASSYSETGSTLSNLVYTPSAYASTPFAYQYGIWGYGRYGERMVSTLSVSGTKVAYWLEGMPGQLNYYNQVYTQTVPIVPTVNLTSLIIGASTTAAGTGMDGFFNGQIAAVFVFNRFADTNLVVAANRAARWLEPETVERVYIGDSLLTGLVGQPRMDIPWLMQQQGLRAQDTCWKNLALSGTYVAHIDSAFARAYLYGVGLISKISRAELYIGAGINDDYGLGDPALTTFGHLTNVVSAAIANGWKPIYMTTQPLWTNATSPYAYDDSHETTRTALVSMVLSNQSLFSGLIRRDKIVTQQILCPTNSPQFSTDGLHFMNLTNGWLANLFIANSFLGVGDYGLRPMSDFYGNLLGGVAVDGSALVNLNVPLALSAAKAAAVGAPNYPSSGFYSNYVVSGASPDKVNGLYWINTSAFTPGSVAYFLYTNTSSEVLQIDQYFTYISAATNTVLTIYDGGPPF